MSSKTLIILSSSPFRRFDDSLCTPPAPQRSPRVQPSSSSPNRLLKFPPVSTLGCSLGLVESPPDGLASFAPSSSLVCSKYFALDSVEDLEAKETVRASPITEPSADISKGPDGNSPKIQKRRQRKIVGLTSQAKATEDHNHNKGAALTNESAIADIWAMSHEHTHCPKLSTATALLDTAVEKDKTRVVKSKTTKPKASRKKAETQARIKKPRITKPRGRPPKQATDVVSEHFSLLQDAQVNPNIEDQRNGSLGLNLEQALKRRTDWTPPKVSQHRKEHSVDGGQDNGGQQVSLATPNQTTKLVNILTTFNFNGSGRDVSESLAPRKTTGEASSKRRKIELVNSNNPATTPTATINTKARKEKKSVPKKKPRTITELATAQYKTNNPVPVQGDGTTISSKLPTSHSNGGTQGQLVTELVGVNFSSAANPDTNGSRSKKPAKTNSKPKKSNARSKGKPTPLPKLLSPKSAAKQIGGQAILFGTSSQLAEDKPPSSVRDFQQAILESEITAESFGVTSNAKLSFTNLRLSRFTAGRSLWTASARDLDNELLLVDPPATTLRHDTVSSLHRDMSEPSSLDHLATSSESENHSEALDDLLPVVPILSVSRSSHRPSSEMSLCITRSEPQYLPPPSNQLSSEITSNLACESIETVEQTNEMFMNADSSERMALRPVSTAASASGCSKEVLPAKKPRGRPRKNPDPKAVPESSRKSKTMQRKRETTKTTTESRGLPPNPSTAFAHIDEIEDSEAELMSSPSRPLTQSNTTAPLELTSPGKSAKLESGCPGKLNLEVFKADLFLQITMRIKHAPRSTDPTKPNWWEKMLMYDPIVLEDLTEWLNNEGVRVKRGSGKGQSDGKGEELVEPWIVQRWCEENSVCCVWRGGLRGVRYYYK